jgi:hypothetical protein
VSHQPRRLTTTIKSVMANDLKVLQNALKKQIPSTHFVNGINVSEEVLDSKIMYVFKDPIMETDNFVQIKQGVLSATSSTTLEALKKHLDLYFLVYGISQKDFRVYLSHSQVNGIVIYNAYSDLRNKNTYFLYFEM